MKADYKNWVPKSMVIGLDAQQAFALGNGAVAEIKARELVRYYKPTSSFVGVIKVLLFQLSDKVSNNRVRGLETPVLSVFFSD